MNETERRKLTPTPAAGGVFGLVKGRFAAAACAVFALASCGGGNPFANPPDVDNTSGASSGQKLSFDFFQQCINPIFEEALPIPGTALTNSCAAGGCHGVAGAGDISTGGSLRVQRGVLQVTDFSSPDTIRASEAMYGNYISSAFVTTIGDPGHSRLLTKPRLIGVSFHGGGLVFDNASDINVRLIEYWISNPVPSNQDEFSNAIPITKDGSGKCTL